MWKTKINLNREGKIIILLNISEKRKKTKMHIEIDTSVLVYWYKCIRSTPT